MVRKMEFHNRYCAELPQDPKQYINHNRQVHEACYSLVKPTPVSNPSLVVYAKEVAELLGLDEDFCYSQKFLDAFSGNSLLNGMMSYASCYGGHQFGNWAGQLGDGRAISLGELLHNKHSWELQLKGAGPTPYSRMGDGRAVLRSSIREFLCSETMHHLGIPTTRALSLVRTGDRVYRDMFYNGDTRAEPGAIVCRVAPSFLRFGNFELFYARRDPKNQKVLLDFLLRHYYPECGEPSKEAYVKMFKTICERTAEMILGWMRVGFVHGVMNTDNMSILGLTIDYGPYGWIDNYDPGWTPNTTDSGQRRYAFGQQPSVALWNLERLANAWYAQIEDSKPLEECLQHYVDHFEREYHIVRKQKIGLHTVDEKDTELLLELNRALQSTEVDMTIFFRQLANCSKETDVRAPEEELLAPIRDALYKKSTPELVLWLRRYQKRLQQEKYTNAERKAHMNRINPKYVLRNYLAQMAIEKSEEGDDSLVHTLLDVMRNPYDEQPEHEEFAQKRPEWARNKAGCSTLSCSS